MNKKKTSQKSNKINNFQFFFYPIVPISSVTNSTTLRTYTTNELVKYFLLILKKKNIIKQGPKKGLLVI